MVAYSFRPQFVPLIEIGTKRQTVRAVGLRRHARPGDLLQLYTGMRTKQCRLIARQVCAAAEYVSLDWRRRRPVIKVGTSRSSAREVDGPAFARADGFATLDHMREFWQRHHPGRLQFEGVLIRW